MSLGTAKRALFLFLTTLIILVIVLGIISVGRFFGKNQYTFKTNSQTVIKELKALNRLETAQFTIEKVIDAGTSGNQFKQLLFGDRILLIAHGQVIAGFDLVGLTNDAVVIDGSTLRLTLPPPQILVTRLDSEQTRVYDRKQGLLTKGDKNLEANARAKAEEVITQGACEGNILDEASKNARNQLTALFKSLGFTTVIIEIPQVSC